MRGECKGKSGGEGGEPAIWTIGHSTRTLEELIGLLGEHGVKTLVDVRHYPGSRRVPQFNREALEAGLGESGIGYVHLVDLGGRRRARPDSRNTAWRNEAFRGYADYMETPEFDVALGRLMEIAAAGRTAIMCAEGVWWRCHRGLISDALKARGWHVLHIMGMDKAEEHPYTPAARVVEGRLSYRGGDL
jgi:uncharacterized protein (DUF488 family)